MAYEIPPLKTIAQALEDEDFVCEFLEPTESRPIDMLLVSIGEDPDEPYIVEITFPGDLLLAMGELETIDEVYTLQFLLRYRFSFDEAYTDVLARFLLCLNRLIPVGAFGMDEETGVIFMQYALLLPTREVDQDVLGLILSSFDSFAPTLGPAIQALGGGQLSFESAIKQLAEQGFPLPPMLPGPASLIEPTED